ncbi:hypothetical protein WG908_10630 [Sphingobium sp. AN641]|uniref:hypothetical protein n=1 Tax=Sphingobium sp. AN641 TaxID=3133443 RepID=UPI0030BEDAE3
MTLYKFVVLSNPVPGKEEDYNRWYSDQHLPDVVRCPDFVNGQRFSLVDSLANDPPYKYLSIFDVETDDPGRTLRDLVSRAGGPEMPSSDAIDRAGAITGMFVPITDVVSK